MELNILGPVEAQVNGVAVPLGRRRERLLLGLLLLEPGAILMSSRLVDLLWGEDPPAGARASLHTHVARLRATLTPYGVGIATRGDGYLIELGEARVDAARFRSLVGHARGAPDAATRAGFLREALDLWRGPLFADVADDDFRSRIGAGLSELHRDAVRQWAEAALADGHPDAVVADLADRLAAEPTAESLAGLLMQAFFQCDRQTDALGVYQRTRDALVDELGIEPGAELQRVHQAILRGEALASRELAARPAQLPREVTGFVGRMDDIRRLDKLAADPSGTVIISAIAGTAGVGKTALAVHWAHRARQRFPDGQLYVNLRGFDPGGTTVSVGEAVRGFLDALAVAPARVPASLDAQLGLYRSLLAGRRMLVLLDNARDPDQVRPLLPGAPGSLVLITSRSQLAGLVATEGARVVGLDLLDAAGSLDLLAERLGREPLAREPAAADRLVSLCAGLPLALAIVAARAELRAPADGGLATLADELAASRGLASLDDAATDVRAVFSWSVDALSPAAARMFRLLGVHPGPDVTVIAAASIAAVPEADAAQLLRELVDAHLLTEPVAGRFTFHDLLRAYAGELSTSDPQGPAAEDRMVGHYRQSGARAAGLYSSEPGALVAEQPIDGVTVERIDDVVAALAWYQAERPVMLAIIEWASTRRRDSDVVRLVGTLPTYFQRQGHWLDEVRARTVAVAAAIRLGDPAMIGRNTRGLAIANMYLGRLDEAHQGLRESLTILDSTDALVERAHVHYNIARVYDQQERPEDTLRHMEIARDLYRDGGLPLGEAHALNATGWAYTRLGRHQESLERCRAALSILRELGDVNGEAATLDSIGHAYQHLGNHERAVAHFIEAKDRYTDLSDRFNVGDVLTHLGDAHRDVGDLTAARQAWTEALQILTDLGHVNAALIQARLEESAPART